MKEKKRLRIGITQGDINGIGCELILKMLSDTRLLDLCTPVLYSSPKVVAYYRKALNLTNFNTTSVRSAGEAQDERINVVNCLGDEVRVDMGKATEGGGEAAWASLSLATKELKESLIDALVTAPVNVDTMPAADFHFNDHTDYLQSEFGGQPLRLAVGNNLRIAFVTNNTPLAKALALLTKERIIERLRQLHQGMLEDFAINKPRIGVLSLNPHARGEEEEKIIAPAVAQAKESGILAFGPYAADELFASEAFTKFDVILAMYYDQGMIAFNTLNMEGSVNVTLGLPIVRTAPAIGTLYEQVGQDIVSPDSLRKALYTACDIVRHRTQYRTLKAGAMRDVNIKQNDNDS